jgi:hypothetical protein
MSVPITITIQDAKGLSGLGFTTIWALIKTGQLKTVRIGRRRLVNLESLQMLLEHGTPSKEISK